MPERTTKSARERSRTTSVEVRIGSSRSTGSPVRAVSSARKAAPRPWLASGSHSHATEFEWSGLRRFGVEGQAGVGEEAGQQVGAVLDAFEPVAYDGGKVVHAGDGEVAQAAFDV